MRRKTCFGATWLAAAAVVCLIATDLKAATIFESGTLGPTGVNWQDALNGNVRGSSVNSAVFSGVRFQVTQSVETASVGGHFFSPAGGSFFGAIIRLDTENDFPNSTDLSTPDVLGAALLAFPVASAEAFGELNVRLDPGWYALAFGSGEFGASGFGGMVLNNPDIGNPPYIARQPSVGWFNLADISDAIRFDDFRFVVRGNLVPEPPIFLHVVTGIGLTFIKRRRFILK